MEQRRDDLDGILFDSAFNLEVNSLYNNRLMEKIKSSNNGNKKIHILAFSLILAGFFMIFAYRYDVKYKVIDIKYKIRGEITSIQNNSTFIKYIIGE